MSEDGNTCNLSKYQQTSYLNEQLHEQSFLWWNNIIVSSAARTHFVQIVHPHTLWQNDFVHLCTVMLVDIFFPWISGVIFPWKKKGDKYRFFRAFASSSWSWSFRSQNRSRRCRPRSLSLHYTEETPWFPKCRFGGGVVRFHGHGHGVTLLPCRSWVNPTCATRNDQGTWYSPTPAKKIRYTM